MRNIPEFKSFIISVETFSDPDYTFYCNKENTYNNRYNKKEKRKKIIMINNRRRDIIIF